VLCWLVLAVSVVKYCSVVCIIITLLRTEVIVISSQLVSLLHSSFIGVCASLNCGNFTCG